MEKIKVQIAITEFAVPAPRKGSIDVHSGLGRNSAEIGQEIHLRLQLSKSAEFPNYQAEVTTDAKFVRADYEFCVGGRMDGFFDGEKPKIEEIKTSFNIYELLRSIKDADGEHPYVLQLKSYGYFHWLKHDQIPDLNLHLVSTRNSESLDLKVHLDLLEYESWLERRLDELVEDVRREEKRKKRRMKVVSAFTFPFPQPRRGQVELIACIEEGMAEKRPMLLQAPTGLGKTMGVMYPTLKEALARGQKLIYITPKNSQHGVAEEALDRLHETGASLKALTITAKSKICMKNEALCNPTFCEYAKDHYTKMADNKLLEKLATKRSLTARVFRNMAEEFQVCPFELQLDAALEADAVICDYNYVFAPRSAFGRLAGGNLLPSGKPNLVIDEAHNLPSRSMDYYSPSLSSFTIERMREDVQKLPIKFRKDMQSLIDSCLAVLRQCGRPGESKPHEIQAPYDLFMQQDQELKAFLSTYLAADVDIQPNDMVMRLSFYWSEFTTALEFVNLSDSKDKRFFTSFHPDPPTVKITCCDASEMLKSNFDDYDQVVAFSATLKPFEFYSRLSGLEGRNLKTAEFVSPFSPDHRKLMVIPQISSKYSDRERNYPRIAEVIHKVASLKSGNYVAFFPSFQFMERVFAQFEVPKNSLVLKQERSMKKDEIDAYLEALKDPTMSHILFAVQGGVFSEGVDFPGSMLIGAFVVGPPLPNFDLEREKMKSYYEEHYQSGFDYAYTYPAMAKAVQAAGRVIRSEQDRGLIVMMDNRFLHPSYVKSMPQDWFRDSAQELTSQQILKDVQDFWETQDGNSDPEVTSP